MYAVKAAILSSLQLFGAALQNLADLVNARHFPVGKNESLLGTKMLRQRFWLLTMSGWQQFFPLGSATPGVRVKSWSRNWPNMVNNWFTVGSGTSESVWKVRETKRGFGRTVEGHVKGKSGLTTVLGFVPQALVDSNDLISASWRPETNNVSLVLTISLIQGCKRRLEGLAGVPRIGKLMLLHLPFIGGKILSISVVLQGATTSVPQTSVNPKPAHGTFTPHWDLKITYKEGSKVKKSFNLELLNSCKWKKLGSGLTIWIELDLEG